MSSIKIVDIETGEIIQRDMNADELAQFKADQLSAEMMRTKQAEAESRRIAAVAKLEAFGLEPDDLQALGL